MPVADLSQTERIRRLRAKIQAVVHAADPQRPELQPPSTSQSIWLNRRFGQAAYTRPIATGEPITTSCCDSSSSI
jgi:hypothetical protein